MNAAAATEKLIANRVRSGANEAQARNELSGLVARAHSAAILAIDLSAELFCTRPASQKYAAALLGSEVSA